MNSCGFSLLGLLGFLRFGCGFCGSVSSRCQLIKAERFYRLQICEKWRKKWPFNLFIEPSAAFQSMDIANVSCGEWSVGVAWSGWVGMPETKDSRRLICHSNGNGCLFAHWLMTCCWSSGVTGLKLMVVGCCWMGCWSPTTVFWCGGGMLSSRVVRPYPSSTELFSVFNFLVISFFFIVVKAVPFPG